MPNHTRASAALRMRLMSTCWHVEHAIHAVTSVSHIDHAHETAAAIAQRPKDWLETALRRTSSVATGIGQILKILAGSSIKTWLLSVIPGTAFFPSAPVVASIASVVVIGAALLQLGLLALRLVA
jgi:hypothetical protein